MRPALLLAVALTLGALPAAAAPKAADPTATDLRCLVVSGVLAQSDDPELKDIGTLSLYYFWGRLEGRLPPGQIAPRLIDEAKQMTTGDVKAQAQTCAAMSKAASQSLSDISDALQKSLGPPPPAAPAASASPETTATAPPGK